MSNGGLIGNKINVPTLARTSGVWPLREQMRAKRQGIWPTTLLKLTADGVITFWDGISDLVLDSTEEYTVECLQNFNATTKMWGAGGACGFTLTEDITDTSNEGPGGAGGYSSANITFNKGQTYIFQIGEGGARVPSADEIGATYLAGGVLNTAGGTQGGGYSGIFKTSATQENALLIAGGGGGGSDSRYSTGGGAGGGTSGENVTELTGLNQGGEGGTQVAGGAPSTFNNATAGSALTGGFGQDNTASLGGGGGGYYGGGGGNVGGGGGGSSYISSDLDIASGSTTSGSGTTPGNSGDSDRGAAGAAGVSGSTSGSDGKILLRLI